MTESTCPKCSKKHFELKSIPKEETTYPYQFIQCSSCGCVVGIIDNQNVPFLLGAICRKLGVDLVEYQKYLNKQSSQ